MKHLVSQPHLIFSVENPISKDLVSRNISHEDAIEHLKSLGGGEVHELLGIYNNPERSILVSNPSEHQLKAVRDLAKQTGQESHIESDGFANKLIFNHGPAAGSVHTGKGTVFHGENAPDNYVSFLPDGTAFTHNFGNSEEIKKSNTISHDEADKYFHSISPDQHYTGGFNDILGKEPKAGHTKKGLPHGRYEKRLIPISKINPDSHENPTKPLKNQENEKWAQQWSKTDTKDAPIIVKQHPSIKGHFQTMDGVHRARVAHLRGQDHIEAYVHSSEIKKSDIIPGGLADKKKPKDFDPVALQEGIKVEMEHTSDKNVAREIAMDHLTEDKKYYKKLKTIESKKIQKGSRQRRLPFNPIKDTDPRQEESVAAWTHEYLPDTDDSFEGLHQWREGIDKDSGNIRERFLQKLHRATKVRRAKDGKREFLLHRGMGTDETYPDQGIVHDTHIEHDKNSSWTPDEYTAQDFAANQRNRHDGKVSAWIHEDSILTVPKQYGQLIHPDSAGTNDFGEFDHRVERGSGGKSVLGPSRYEKEHEVIVGPHKSQRAFPNKDFPSKIKPSPIENIHQRINARGMGEGYLNYETNKPKNILEHRRNKKLAASELRKGLKGDWKKEGYTFKIHPTIQDHPAGKFLKISAYSPDGQEVGRYSYNQPTGRNPYPAFIETHREHQRKGIATAAHMIAEKHYGSKLVPEYQSKEAKALWAQPERPFGKSSDSEDMVKLYHITDNPQFKLNPKYAPEDNSISIHDRSGRKGIYTTPSVEAWVNGHGYARPFVAELHVPKSLVSDKTKVGGRWGGEKFIPSEHFDKVKIHRVIPIDAHAREMYGSHGWFEGESGEHFDTGKPITTKDIYPFKGYKYPGKDVREMSPEEADQLKQRFDRGYKARFGKSESSKKLAASEMSKNRPIPKFNQYGMSGRFDQDVMPISTPRQVSIGTKTAHQMARRAGVKPQAIESANIKGHLESIKPMEAEDAQLFGANIGVGKEARAYSTPGNVSAAQHEAFHNALAKIKSKHGQNEYDKIIDVMSSHIHPNDAAAMKLSLLAHGYRMHDPSFEEENLAHIHTYLTSDRKRQKLKEILAPNGIIDQSIDNNKKIGSPESLELADMLEEMKNKAKDFNPARLSSSWSKAVFWANAQKPKAPQKLAASEKLAKAPMIQDQPGMRRPHTPSRYEGMDVIHTFDAGTFDVEPTDVNVGHLAGKPLYHHVYKNPDYEHSAGKAAYLHALSLNKDPWSDTEIVASSSVSGGSNKDNLWSPGVPWNSSFAQIGESITLPSFRNRGLGKKLYEHILGYHKKLASDTSVSPSAQRVWQHISRQSGVKANIGQEGKRDVNWAETRREYQKPISSISYGGESDFNVERKKKLAASEKPPKHAQSPKAGITTSKLKQLKQDNWHNPDTGLEISEEEGQNLLNRRSNSAAERQVDKWMRDWKMRKSKPEKIDSQYRSDANAGYTVLVPAKVSGETHLAPDVIHHMTVKMFRPYGEDFSEENKGAVNESIKNYKLPRLDPSKLKFTPQKVVSPRNGQVYHSLKIEGVPKEYEDFYNKFAGQGVTYDKFQPHITISKEMHDKFVSGHPIHVEFGEPHLMQGNTPIMNMAHKDFKKSETLKKAPIIHDQNEEFAGKTIDDNAFDSNHHEGLVTKKLKNGLFHHIYKNKNSKNSTIHSLSNGNPSQPLSIIVGHNYEAQGPESPAGFYATYVATEPEHQGKGYGTGLKYLATKHHGRVMSDSIVSNPEQSSWNKLKRIKGVKVDMGETYEGDPEHDIDSAGIASDSPNIATWKGKKKLAASEMEKMSRPTLKFPKLDVDSRPDSNVRLISTPRQKKIYGKVIANRQIMEERGKESEAEPDFLPGSGTEIWPDYQKLRDSREKQTMRGFGTKWAGLSAPVHPYSPDSFESALAGKYRNTAERDAEKLEEHKKQYKESRNKFLADHRTWRRRSNELMLQPESPERNKEIEEHLRNEPKFIKPRKPAKKKISNENLSNEQRIDRDRKVDSTIHHEAGHRLFHQIGVKYGNEFKQRLMEDMLAHFHPETLKALKHHTQKLKYSPKSKYFNEEVINAARDILVQKGKREFFKDLNKEKADAHIKNIKQAWNKIVQHARSVAPPNTQDKKLAASELQKKETSIPQVKLNPEHGKVIAQAYDQMKHDPNHPEVKAAYSALINETKAQFKDMLSQGFKFSQIKPGQENPYKTSKDLHNDIKNNKHLHFFPTVSGFGSDDNSPKDHPMLQPSGFMHEGKPLLANDLFRIVHDYRGHHLGGESGFGPKGEHQAFLTHKKDFSPLAQKALASETLGQNSWVTAGPYAEHNKKNPHQTVYAEQKAGLLPDHIINGKWHGEE